MLIVINTWKRKAILAATLQSVMANKHPDSAIAIVDDATPGWTPPDGNYIVWPVSWHLGAGMARRYALERSLETEHDAVLFMDNDLDVKPGFDVRTTELWLKHRVNHPGCMASPFRPAGEHTPREIDFGQYIFSTSAAGAMLIMDRALIQHVLNRMVPDLWTNLWDYIICGFVNGCIKPHESYATHTGVNDPDAMHPQV